MNHVVIDLATQQPQRYQTMGDYCTSKDSDGGEGLYIRVTDSGDWRSNFLVGLHEMVEAALCIHGGVSFQAIDEFDMQHPELDEPGDCPQAPYHRAHSTAMQIERIVCGAMGISWEDHEAKLRQTYDKTYGNTEA